MGAGFVEDSQMFCGQTESKLRRIIVGRGADDALKIRTGVFVVVQIEIAGGEIAAGQGVRWVFRQNLLEDGDRGIQTAVHDLINSFFVEFELGQAIFGIGVAAFCLRTVAK